MAIADIIHGAAVEPARPSVALSGKLRRTGQWSMGIAHAVLSCETVRRSVSLECVIMHEVRKRQGLPGLPKSEFHLPSRPVGCMSVIGVEHE